MKRTAWIIVVLGGFCAANAFAQGSSKSGEDPCLSTPVEGQKLQRAGKLLEARSRFEVCARDTCPEVVSQSCKRWLAQVEADLPSVQFSARDQDGLDVSDVEVSIDGKPAMTPGPGAVDIDPGEHTFVFRHQGSVNVTRRVVIDKGTKKVGVSVIFSPAPARTPAPSASRPQQRRDTERQSASGPSRPVPTLSWVLGGIGVAGLASFATFGTLGLVQRGGSNCAQSAPHGTFNSCQSSAFTKFRVADILLGVAVVGLGAATWVYLKRPTIYERSTAFAVGVAPTAHGAIAAVGATF